MRIIYTVLVDDNARYRASLVALLAQWPDIRLIGEADSGAGGLELVAQLQPELLLVDVVMPGMSGIELTRRVKSLTNAPRVLVLSMHALSAYRVAALEAGADGFLIKDQVPAELAHLIHRLFPQDSGSAGTGPPADAT